MSEEAKLAARQALRALAEVREEHAAATAAVRVKTDLFRQENRALLDYEASLREECSNLEATARLAIVRAYEATGDKKPAPGAGIRVMRVLVYDAAEAFTWAKEHKMCVVPEHLDVEAFEVLAARVDIPFVGVREEPQATIAKALDINALSGPPAEEVVA